MYKIIARSGIFALIIIGCSKYANVPDIVLTNQPLTVIQESINGRWKLDYGFGGIGGIRYEAKANEYINFEPYRIVIGNDQGVIVDTSIVWKKVPSSRTDSAYILTYQYQGRQNGLLVKEIKDNSLIISEYASDAVTYYYKKIR